MFIYYLPVWYPRRIGEQAISLPRNDSTAHIAGVGGGLAHVLSFASGDMVLLISQACQTLKGTLLYLCV